MSKKVKQKETKTQLKKKENVKANIKNNDNNKKSIIIITSIIVAIILILLIGYKILTGGYSDNASVGRCSDSSNYALTDEQIENMKGVFADISEIENVKIWTNVCTVKILVNLKSDVELDTMKAKATEMLTKLESDQLSYFDYTFYITSNNEESPVYPVMVSKNKQRENFAW